MRRNEFGYEQLTTIAPDGGGGVAVGRYGDYQWSLPVPRLTARQRVFIEEFLFGAKPFNATAAAIAAGYSKRAASEIGYENLRKPQIAAEIERRLSGMTMSTEEALVRLTEQGRGAHARFIDSTGRVNIRGLKEAGLGHLIKGVKETRYGLVVEFHDAQAAIDKILRVRGAYVEKREHEGELTLRVVYGTDGTDRQSD